MKKKRLCLFFILMVGLLYSENKNMDFNPYDNWPTLMPASACEGEALKIVLVTTGPGSGISNLYSWWGHAALIVEKYDLKDKFNPELKDATSYDYGTFSIQEKDFAKNFIQGRLNFLVTSGSARWHQALYLDANRSLVFQELDFEPEVKWQIAKFLETNALRENSIYLYHHYNNNCATVLRDIIDVATNRQLSQVAKAIPSEMTIRDHARRSMKESYIADFVLNFLQSSVIDKEISVWEAMFLPAEIKDFIVEFKYTDSKGKPRNLVKSSVSKALPEAIPFVSKEKRTNAWILSLLAGLGFGFLGAFLLSLGNRTKLFRIFGGLYFAIIYFLLFIIGFVLFYMMLFTNHDITFKNMNIIFINPGLILLFIFSIMYAAGSKAGRYLLIIFNFAFAIAAGIALALNLLGITIQDNIQIIAFALPFYFLSGLGSFFRNLIPSRK